MTFRDMNLILSDFIQLYIPKHSTSKYFEYLAHVKQKINVLCIKNDFPRFSNILFCGIQGIERYCVLVNIQRMDVSD